MFIVLCIQYKIVPVQYFLDEMKGYEADIIFDNIDEYDRLGWEHTRMQMYSSLAPYSKKKLKLEDVMELPWDKKARDKRKRDKQPKEIEISNRDRDTMKRRAKQIEEMLNKTKNEDAIAE